MVDSRTLDEVVVALHFVTRPLTIMDVASWVEAFSPGVQPQQLPPLPSPPWPRRAGQVQISLPVGQLPRILIRPGDQHEFLMFQHDRVALGWRRTEPPGTPTPYPGYATLRGRFRDLVEKFNAWGALKLGAAPMPRLVELTYSNVYMPPTGAASAAPDAFVPPQIGGRAAKELVSVWWEELPSPQEGFVQVTAQVASVPPAVEAFRFNYSGIAPVIVSSALPVTDPKSAVPLDPVLAAVLLALDHLHGHIHTVHSTAMPAG